MKCRCVVFVLLFFGLTTTINAQEEARLSAVVAPTGEIVIVIQPDFHSSWGFLYPMTYQLDIPQNSNSLKVEKKHGTGEAWVRLPEKASTDLFNAIEAVRFDYAQSRAYVSAAFAPTGDSLFLRVSDQTNRAMVPTYRGISQYYDNRRAAVTITADDWSDWTAGVAYIAYRHIKKYGLLK